MPPNKTFISWLFPTYDDEEMPSFDEVVQQEFRKANTELEKFDESLQDLMKLSEERDRLAKVRRVSAMSIARYSVQSTDLYSRAMVEGPYAGDNDAVTYAIWNNLQEIRALRKSITNINFLGLEAAKTRRMKKRKEKMSEYEARVILILPVIKEMLERKDTLFEAGIYSLLLMDKKYHKERLLSKEKLMECEEERMKSSGDKHISQANNASCTAEKVKMSFFPKIFRFGDGTTMDVPEIICTSSRKANKKKEGNHRPKKKDKNLKVDNIPQSCQKDDRRVEKEKALQQKMDRKEKQDKIDDQYDTSSD